MPSADPRIQQLLDLPLDPDNDSGQPTVRGYLIELLATLWREEEGFSGKKPFGNSSWQYDIYVPAVKAGVLPGRYSEEWGELEDFDYESADELIEQAIRSLGGAQ